MPGWLQAVSGLGLRAPGQRIVRRTTDLAGGCNTLARHACNLMGCPDLKQAPNSLCIEPELQVRSRSLGAIRSHKRIPLGARQSCRFIGDAVGGSVRIAPEAAANGI